MNFKRYSKYSLKSVLKSPFKLSNRSSQMSNVKNANKPNDDNPESAFECNICLETAKNAVISMCGHLFW